MSSKTKIFRVTSLSEFDLLKKGNFYKTNFLWFKYVHIENEKNIPLKLSVAASKKYGNAIARNLLKRRIKNAIYAFGQNNIMPENIIVLVGVDRDYTEEISYENIQETINLFFNNLSKKNN